jgi:hypothetical protein
MDYKLPLFDNLNIPQRCLINQKITKKTLLENAIVKASFKKVVRDDIHEMLVVASVSPQSSNINSFVDDTYSFDEILLLHVTLRKKDSYIKSADLLQSSIPYSLVIVFQYQDEICFNIAEKRINQVDKEKRVIGNYTFTEWLKTGDDKLNKFIDSIAFNNLSHIDLKSFYEDVTNRIYNLQTASITGEYQAKSTEETQSDVEILRQIKQINSDIVSFKSQYKKEINYNAKVKINVKIKRLEIRKKELQQVIKNNSN